MYDSVKMSLIKWMILPTSLIVIPLHLSWTIIKQNHSLWHELYELNKFFSFSLLIFYNYHFRIDGQTTDSCGSSLPALQVSNILLTAITALYQLYK